MGTRNRQRRREKAKKHAEQVRLRSVRGERDQPRRSRDAPGDEARRVREALWFATGARRDASASPEATVKVLCEADFPVVCEQGEAQFSWLIGTVWERGWQPTELARHGRRVRPEVGRIVAAAIAADHAGRDRTSMHPSWVAQADEFRLGSLPPSGWLEAAIALEDTLQSGGRLLLVMDSLGAAVRLGRLPSVIPPPGSDPATWTRDTDTAGADDPVLAKVRALLAQAESTTFEAEAEAFTAKAQELMARHAIDSALLWSQTARSERPITIRLPNDDPYADAKALLLQVVATRSQCRMIMHPDYALNSVVGFASDVAATELLYTSLLVQSQTAMRAEAAAAPAGSRVRSRSFRASFLASYAVRIGDRLDEINTTVKTAAAGESSSALLPVLLARTEAVDVQVEELFGKLSQHSFRGPTDRLGYDRGKQAADRAELNPRIARAPRSVQPELESA